MRYPKFSNEAWSAMNPWNRFHNEFKFLMEEEDTIVRERGLRGWFHGSVIYEESREFGSWSFDSITTESLQARFDVVAAEAGIALGSPPGTLPGVYWLDRLFADLRANKSQHIRIFNEAGGFIERLFEASATFCARLNRQSLEDAVMSPEGPRVVCEPANEGGEIITGEASDTEEESVRERSERGSAVPVKDLHLDLLEKILSKNTTTLEKWANKHKFGRTTVFDWKSRRRSGKSPRGKISSEKSGEIQKAIEKDAAELGLTTRTSSD
jgi:hypothetical protein